jgi:uncharacterized membrane protein
MFSIPSESDAQMFKTFSGLIKTADGLFKSEKQAKFILQCCETREVDSMMKYFGVTIAEGNFVYIVNCMNSWASYGSRGDIPQSFVFVFDEYGIVSKWKVPFNGNLRIGASPDPARTSKVWERTATPYVPLVKLAPVTETVKSQFIGEIGEKIEVEGEIIHCKSFSGQSMGYWDSGIRFITKIKTGNNILTYWGYPKFKGEQPENNVMTGLKVKVKATIKSHDEYKDNKTTVISRPSFSIVI